MTEDREPLSDFFARSADELMATAISEHRPVAIFAGFSGGDDSLALAHWMMTNVPGTRLFHIDTGIGVRRTRLFVEDTAARHGWPLTIISALDDCGQDYDAIVREHGFPGPSCHQFMYRRLKDRAIDLIVRRSKTALMDRILFATGVRHDESARRMGYKGREINRRFAQVWVNPIYWWSREQRDRYLMENQLRRNPVSAELGLSGECLCGAFAHPGELERLRAVDPDVAARIDALAAEVADRFPWGWEGRPPASEPPTEIGPMCRGCSKSSVVQAELALLDAWPDVPVKSNIPAL